MSYICTLYKNSGFNAVNIPDSPTLLNSVESITVPAIEIMQDRGLDAIRVKATWSAVRDVDYIQLTDGTTQWFYMVTGCTMAATDVAVLSVLPDYITSAGGVSALTILDGITERVCVSDDTFGAYKQDDPYLTPAETPQVIYSTINPAIYSGTTYCLVETTLDLVETGTDATAVTYTDSAGDGTVTVPQTVDAPGTTNYEIYDADGAELSQAPDLGTIVYNGNQSGVKEGIKRARGITDNAILKRVAIPAAFVQCVDHDTDSSAHVPVWFSDIRGKWWSLTSSLPYEYATVNNKRVLYGNFNKYGIVTASGAKSEWNPEDIYDSANSEPMIDCIADPHLDGKPYYRYETIDGHNGFQNRTFFIGAVAGAQWQNVPLVYTEKAGNAFDTLNYNYNMEARDRTYQNMLSSAARGVISEGLGIGSDVAHNGITPGNALSVAYNAVNFGENIKSNTRSLENYLAATRLEAAQYLRTTGCNVPEIAIPYNSSLYRDFYGNGAIAYRYRYTANDITRLDKILTMYGYKHTKTLEASDFTNRTHFNYVQSSISVTGLPRWFADGISDQLQGGVRIWHELPNTAALSNNPIKT